MNRHVLSAMVVSILFATAAPQAHAILPSAQESSVGIQSSLINSDFGALATIFGSVIGANVNYHATTLASGWSGTLTGNYLGKNINFTYTGDLSAFPAGQITWTTVGTYGLDVMNSSGHANIVDTPTGFTIQNYANSATLGSNAWMEMGDMDVQVTPGSPFPSLSGFGQPMKSFTAGVAAPETKWSAKFFSEDKDGNWTDRTIERRIVEGGHKPQHVIESSGRKATISANDFSFDVMLTLVIPEPSTLLLIGTGFIGLLTHRPRRQSI